MSPVLGFPFFKSGGGAPAPYTIDRSVRFRTAASSFLQRTPGTTSNRQRWTWSGWVKQSDTAAQKFLWGAADASGGTNYDIVDITGAGVLRVYFNGSTSANLETNQRLRDSTAWYHVVVSVDTTRASPGDRINVAINGTLATFSSSAFPALNYNTNFNLSGRRHMMAANPLTTPNTYFDGYLAEVNFIDGLQVDASSFGEFNTDGVWVPKEYSGSYGTNGFYLPFDDPTSLATLASDNSGNGNNWTATNVSLTAGVTYDSMVDTPTDNFATFNPLAETLNPATVSRAGLAVAASGGTVLTMGSTIPVRTGKWYFEFTVATVDGGSTYPVIGIRAYQRSGNAPGGLAYEVGYFSDGQKFTNGALSAYGSSYSSSNVIGCAFDLDNNTVTFYRDNVSQGAIAISAVPSDAFVCPTVGLQGSESGDINFGQRAFLYTPPTGFLALSTANVSGTVLTSGTFTGNANANGPFIWARGTPATLTINGNAVTFGTNADRLAGGFKLRTSSATFNAAGSNTWTATAGAEFAVPNTAQTSP